VALTGVTTTETSFEVGAGPFRFSGVKRYAQDSLKITYPNGVTVEATGALAAELWRNRAADRAGGAFGELLLERHVVRPGLAGCGHGVRVPGQHGSASDLLTGTAVAGSRTGPYGATF
jgi:hypothetical protein